jgi:hypothetical protein
MDLACDTKDVIVARISTSAEGAGAGAEPANKKIRVSTAGMLCTRR